jgi:trans-aconitate methyltransferase
MPTDESGLRAANAQIADAYDHVPYDPPASPGLDAERVFGITALYGCTPSRADIDILDLGCGTGAQLARAGAQTSGRVVGTDLSRSACALAEKRCAAFSDRARIVCADIIDLAADDLGTFDLIYHVGVLYITPPEVQQRLLQLIAACLKPGGVAVISYYAGTQSVLHAALQPVLRLSVDADAAPAARVKQARACLQDMAQTLSQQPGDHRTMLGVLQQAQMRDDAVLFHELLNHSFAALATSSLEAALGAQGVHFLNWMMPGHFSAVPSPRARALKADAEDMAGGGYHYALFGKCTGEKGFDVCADNVLWHTRLMRTGAREKDLTVFRDTAQNVTVNAGAVMASALDALGVAPSRWQTLAAVVSREIGKGGDPSPLAILERECLLLWQHGLLTPVWTSRG